MRPSQPQQDIEQTAQPDPVVQQSQQAMPSDDIFNSSQALPGPTSADKPLSEMATPLEAGASRYFNDLRTNIINIPRLKEEEVGLVWGKQKEQEVKTLDDANTAALQSNINSLPTDEKSWADTWAPDALSFMTDPEMVGSAALAEFGIKKVLPEATEAMSTLGKFGLTVGRATAASTLAGATVNGANQLINLNTPQEMSLPHYITNTLEWSGFGLGEGALRGVLPMVKPFIKNAIKKATNKDVVADLDSTLAPNVSRETLANTVDTNVVKASSGKVMDSTTSIEAGHNQIKDDFNNQREQYNNLNDDQKANTLSPDEEYQSSIQAHQDARDAAIDNISNIIKNIHDDYTTPEALHNGLHKTTIPTLVKAQNSLKFASNLTDNSIEGANNLLNTINHNVPTAGPARRISKLITMPLVGAKDSEYLENLEKPQFNLDELNNTSDKISDDNKQLIENRKNGLQQVIDQGTPEPINNHLDNLNDAVKNLDTIDTDLKQAKANYALRQQPKTDITPSAVKDAQDLSDPNQTVAGLNTHPDAPVSPKEQTYKELDDKINNLHKEGVLTDEDMENLKKVDAINNHEGRVKVMQRLANCILDGGTL